MIAVDSSALIAILLAEPDGPDCRNMLQQNSAIISAATLTEVLIVAAGFGIDRQMSDLIEALGIDVVALTADVARDAAIAYGQWGKGNHPARLNFGDCFSYALARDRNCPLLFVGNDFSQTDIRSVL